MKLTEQQMIDVLDMVSNMQVEYKWRLGQCVFNAIHTLYPEAANKICATEYDPFFDDKIVPACINYLLK